MASPGIIVRCCVVIGFALGIAACGGGGGGDQGAAGSQPTQPVPSGIGAAGGTVLGPNGSKVEIPSGALAVVTQIAVDQTSLNAPPLPAGLTPIGQMFAFTPHGTAFATPATITMPFNPASVPAGATPALFKTNSQNQWEKVANATFGASSVTAQVSSFSFGQVVTEDLPSAAAVRKWRFSEMINTGFGATGTQSLILGQQFEDVGGDLVDVHDFGPTSFDSGFQIFDGTDVVQNGIASGVVASAGDTRTFQVATEAPRGNSNIPGEILGSETELVQEQTFLKQQEDATLTFTMPLARIELHDENAILRRICPDNAVTCDFIQGQLKLDVEARAFDPEFTQFFNISSIATLSGFAENWRSDARTTLGSHVRFWNNLDFELDIEDINGASDSKAVLRLIGPLSFNVDLSSVPVGETFLVRITANASAYNRLSGAPSEFPTSAAAYINFEPSSGSGGGIFTTDGLEQVDPPAEIPDPPPIPLPPIPCPGGVNPAAGVLQFSAATYTSPETDTPPTVTVTRTGGSTGAVSATLTTIGGTATADSDFEPVNATVLFADGDTEPRVVVIPIVEDSIAEGNETVELQLSQPGGCARIGTQDTAIVTIVDDDFAPGPSGLDGAFSGDGKAVLEGFGGDRSGMAVQPDGKVIMVGGTFTDFIMARFNANGSLDDGFGDSGRVTLPIIGSQTSLPQEANAVAVQRDGKIVVVGNARTPNPGSRTAIALVRLNANGSLDDTFGAGGFVFGPTFVFGRAFAVAIDGEDRIVVAGDAPVAGNVDFGDFIVARFQPDGDIDTSFGQAGVAITDVGGVTNEAHGLKVFSDNSLLVSGFAPIVVSNVNGANIVSEPLTAVVRYREDGTLDPTFDGDGRVALPGDNVGRGLAVQADGRILLAGSIETAELPLTETQFALMRLLADGTIDESFGNDGRVQTAFTERGDAAFGVALQADGKIVVGGASNTQVNSNFAVARYESDGDLDTTFTDDGKLTIDFFGFTDVAENIAIDSNGRIVLGGLARNNVDGYGVARVLP